MTVESLRTGAAVGVGRESRSYPPPAPHTHLTALPTNLALSAPSLLDPAPPHIHTLNSLTYETQNPNPNTSNPVCMSTVKKVMAH